MKLHPTEVEPRLISSEEFAQGLRRVICKLGKGVYKHTLNEAFERLSLQHNLSKVSLQKMATARVTTKPPTAPFVPKPHRAYRPITKNHQSWSFTFQLRRTTQGEQLQITEYRASITRSILIPLPDLPWLIRALLDSIEADNISFHKWSSHIDENSKQKSSKPSRPFPKHHEVPTRSQIIFPLYPRGPSCL